MAEQYGNASVLIDGCRSAAYQGATQRLDCRLEWHLARNTLASLTVTTIREGCDNNCPMRRDVSMAAPARVLSSNCTGIYPNSRPYALGLVRSRMVFVSTSRAHKRLIK